MNRALALAVPLLLVTLLACTADDPAPPPTSAAPPEATPTATVTSTPGVSPTPLAVSRPRGKPENLPQDTPLLHPGEQPRSDDLDDAGWPRDAVGPLVVYERLADGTFEAPTVAGNAAALVDRVYEYVTYDLGTGRALSSFVVAASRGPARTVAGTNVFVNYYGELWVYGLDGSGGRLLLGGGEELRTFERFTPNADGTLLAVNHYRVDETAHHADNRLQVIEVATGDVLLDVTQAEADAAGIEGLLSPSGWSEDEQTLAVEGHAHRDGISLQGTLTMEGEFEFFPQSGDGLEFVEPLRRHPSVRRGEGTWCQYSIYNGIDYIELYDLETGAVVNAVRDEWPVFRAYQWSPDGAEFLYLRHTLTPDDGETLAEARLTSECGPEDAQARAINSPSSWFVLPADGGDPVEVASPEAAHERWYGDRLVTYACGGGVTLDGYLPADPDCRGAEHELRIGGRAVATGDQLRVLGLIEEPATASASP